MIGKVIELPKIVDPRGNLTVAEQLKNVPFQIARVYWTYDIPGGERRGGHAHRGLYQLLFAISGSFTVTVDDGCRQRTFTLNKPYQGLLLTPGIWRTIADFSACSVCLVLASEQYAEGDYIRDYDEFLDSKRKEE